jgi:phage-related protein
MYQVEFVETRNNKKPFIEFINLLSPLEKAEVFAVIDKFCYMKNNSIQIPLKLSKYLREGIFELRINHRNRISRCLYFYFEGERIVITHGFVKKSNRTPNEEITKGTQLRKEYIQMKKGSQ